MSAYIWKQLSSNAPSLWHSIACRANEAASIVVAVAVVRLSTTLGKLADCRILRERYVPDCGLLPRRRMGIKGLREQVDGYLRLRCAMNFGKWRTASSTGG